MQVLLIITLHTLLDFLQAAAKLSEPQVQDMLYLWTMCTTRRGQLANERKSKLIAVPAESFSDVQMPNARLGPHFYVQLLSAW